MGTLTLIRLYFIYSKNEIKFVCNASVSMGFVNPTAVTVSHAWTFDFVNPCQFWQILWQDGRNFTESSTRSCFQMNVSVILLKIDKNLLFCRFFIFAKTSRLTQLTNNLKKTDCEWKFRIRLKFKIQSSNRPLARGRSTDCECELRFGTWIRVWIFEVGWFGLLEFLYLKVNV